MSHLWHCVTISNHKKVISIIEYLSRDRIQFGVSQSKSSILIGLLIGVQKVEILRNFRPFGAPIPQIRLYVSYRASALVGWLIIMTHRFYESYWSVQLSIYSQMSLNVLEDVSEWHLSLHSKHRETVFEWILIRPWFWPIRESDFRINSKLIRWTIRKIKILFQLTRETCCNLIWWFATILATISSYGQSVLCDRPCPESPEM